MNSTETSKQKYLALETSSPCLSLALGNETEVVRSWSGAHMWRHAESLLEGIEAILKKQRWTWNQLTGVAVSVGPGSFTGIRIGLSAARALGQFLHIPVVGISALETLAFGQKGTVINPTIDALREHWYVGLYQRQAQGRWKRLQPDACLPREAVQQARSLWRKKFGALTLVESGDLHGHYPRASDVLLLAQPRLAKAGSESYKQVLPLYLRDATAVERRKALRK